MTKTHIVIHHSATSDSGSMSWQAVRRYHLEKGWTNIGYNLGVERIGEEYEMLLGRPLDAQAAGEPKDNFNRKGIHICFIGNFDLAPPEMRMWRFAGKHITALMALLHIPIENIIGHREIANVSDYKQCPGKFWDMKQFRKLMEVMI